MFLLICATGAALYESETTPQELDNFTSKIDYDSIYEKNNLTFIEDGNNEDSEFLPRVISKFSDLIFFVTLESSKKALQFGYDNPQYDFDFAWKLMFISIFASFIVPLTYIIGLIGYLLFLGYKKIKKYMEVR